MPDIRSSVFGTLVLRTGLATKEQIQECLRAQANYQKQGKKQPRLGELLAAKGFLTVDQVRSLLKKQAQEQKKFTPPPPKPLVAEAPPLASVPPPPPAQNPPPRVAGTDSATTPTSPPAVAATAGNIGVEFGDFKILKRLGEDASGYTYKAKYIPNNTQVILRTLSHETMNDSPDYVKRFEKQIEKATKLRHENIQNIITGGRLSGRDYYAAEYIEGISLRRILEARGKLDLELGLKIGIQVALALEAGHAQGLFHQEVRPSNVLITPEKNVKLAGYGAAHDVIGNLRKLATDAGDTPFYVAPEQALPDREGQGDARSDLYCLGATLYHALTGQPPFTGASVEEVLMNLAEEDVPDPTLLNADISQELSDILLSLINPEPDDRYQSARQLLDDLEKCQEKNNAVGLPSVKSGKKGGISSILLNARQKSSGNLAGSGRGGRRGDQARSGGRRTNDKGRDRRGENRKRPSNVLMYTLICGVLVLLGLIVFMVMKMNNKKAPVLSPIATPAKSVVSTKNKVPAAGEKTVSKTKNGTSKELAKNKSAKGGKPKAPVDEFGTPKDISKRGLLGSVNHEGGDEIPTRKLRLPPMPKKKPGTKKKPTPENGK